MPGSTQWNGLTRKPLRAKSKRQSAYDREYKARSKLVLARAAGRCEVLAAHDCDGMATPHPHHRKFRSQGGSNSTANLIAVCASAHHWIHVQLFRHEAVALGLIIPQSVPEYPYTGELVEL